MENVVKQIESGFFEPLKVSEWTNISTGETPHYIFNRSTSQLENLHQLLHSLLSCATSALMVHYLVSGKIFRFNQQKANWFDSLDKEHLCQQCYDPRLLSALFESAKKLKSIFPSPVLRYLKRFVLQPITEQELINDLSLQSGVYRNKSIFSLACQSVHMNAFTQKQLDAMIEFNLTNHVNAALITQDESITMSNLPMAMSYVTTEHEKILMEHIRQKFKNPAFRMDASSIKKASDFLSHFNWLDITLAFNQTILDAYELTDVGQGQKYGVRIKRIIVKRFVQGRDGIMKEEDCELDVRQLSLKEAEHVKSYLLDVGKIQIAATINKQLKQQPALPGTQALLNCHRPEYYVSNQSMEQSPQRRESKRQRFDDDEPEQPPDNFVADIQQARVLINDQQLPPLIANVENELQKPKGKRPPKEECPCCLKLRHEKPITCQAVLLGFDSEYVWKSNSTVIRKNRETRLAACQRTWSEQQQQQQQLPPPPQPQ